MKEGLAGSMSTYAIFFIFFYAQRSLFQTLYADSPIDSSLFSLYVHQNYTQFCNEIEETEGVADWLSWVDSSGGEAVCIFFLPSMASKMNI